MKTTTQTSLKLHAFLALLAFAFLASCDASKDSKGQSSDSQQVNNKDVTWTGTYAGLEPVLSERARIAVAQLIAEQKMGKMDTRRKYLLLLKDSDHFVIAHVLLTKSRIGVRYPISGDQWNKLHVKLLNNGEVQIDTSQMAEIEKYWLQETE